MCSNFVDLNPYTAFIFYPIPDPQALVDISYEADLWVTVDIKSAYHNFEVTPEAQEYLGIVTQDGLFVYQRMPFGMDTASQWCQYAMDVIVARAQVSKAKAFFDDVTIPGHQSNWRGLWEDAKRVIRELVGAGFMIGLKKCQFLVPKVEVLGHQLIAGGYKLATKFIKSWDEPKPPSNLKGLQRILGKLLWASPFIPEFKRMVAPLERLLSSGSSGEWG